jgi:hypothetical protein
MGYSKLTTFNVFDPFDALRLRLLFSNILNHATHVMESIDPVLLKTTKNGDFHCWKQSKVIREQNQRSDLESSIQGWRDGVSLAGLVVIFVATLLFFLY